MKISDVVFQLRSILPKYSSVFSQIITPISVEVLPAEATFNFWSSHNLADNEGVTLTDFFYKNPIVSYTQDGFFYTFETANYHDITSRYYTTVKLSGFSAPVWNGEFTLQSVPSAKTFTIQSTEAAPVLTGSEALLENRVDGINGSYPITVIDSDSFKISGNFLAGDYEVGSVNSAIRIVAVVDIERGIEQYTKKNLSDYWVFVTGHSAVISKDRNAQSDATATRTASDNMHLRMIDGFSIFVIKNCTQDIGAVEAVDFCRHDLQTPLLKSLYGFKFPTGLSGGADFKTILTGHSIYDYRKAILIYEYAFETPMDLTDQDTVEPIDTVAFRNIFYTEKIGTQELTANIILED